MYLNQPFVHSDSYSHELFALQSQPLAKYFFCDDSNAQSREKAAFEARNPRTQEKLWVPSKMVPTFKFSPVFKNRVAAIAQHDEAPTETTTQQPIVAQQPIVQQQPIVAQQPVVEMQPGVAQQPVLEMQPTPHKTL